MLGTCEHTHNRTDLNQQKVIAEVLNATTVFWEFNQTDKTNRNTGKKVGAPHGTEVSQTAKPGVGTGQLQGLRRTSTQISSLGTMLQGWFLRSEVHLRESLIGQLGSSGVWMG